MKHLLAGKTAVVTGATSGIGKEIALYFSENGASVAILGTNKERGEQVVAACEQKKVTPDQTFFFFPVDIASFADTEKTFKEIFTKFPQVDALVNNAGITKDALLLRMSEEDWDKVIDVNLKSLYNTCKNVIRPMMKAKNGNIINISSVVGLMGNPGQANYAAAKSGMIGFTKSLAKELASRGLCANCIAPGYIETPMTESLPDKVKEDLMNHIPLGRMGQPKDIAEAALFLATTKYITGQVLTVDGGMVM
jgi:3-oxoacyl-[acyl-carrier protein] reductase